MKNVIIVILVLIVGALGFLLLSDNDEQTTKNTGNSSDINATETEATNGDTINLSNQGLEQLSTDILDNSSVTTLDVSGNDLTGALPAEIRKLSNLKVLIASDNKLTGIPAEIGQLSKLRSADFSNNDISGLPLEIGNLKNLETLDLRGNPNVSEYDLSLIQPEIPNAQILVD